MRAAAIYARVSTPRQGREQTIESQLDTLKSWANENGHELAPENIHADEGYSGSRLDRPGLDALRDGAEDGAFEVVGVLSPDRLARKYAYQVLLLEELGRAGCEVMFLHHPISEDPNDQLLLQIQGAIAEYERAMIAERFRRGKLQKAREGHFIGGKAPYGYRYIPKRDGVPGHLAIDETEAEMVRTLFGWLVEERMSIRQITKRLNEGSWYPRSGEHPWSPSTVHSILSHPIHAGTTYANRYRYVAPEKPQGRRARSGENTCRVERPREEWIPIPAPAIVDEDTHRRAQDQLERNAELSFRNNKKYSYLLRCLLTCESCGLAMHGVTNKSPHQATRRYYQCAGKNPISSAREHRCLQTSAKIEELDAAVWDHVKELMADPKRLAEQFENYASLASEGAEKERAEAKALEARLKRLAREDDRLIDAYQAEIISLKELKERREKLAERRKALGDQHEQQARLRRQTAQARETIKDLRAFCERINARIEEAAFEEKQSILQLLIERVIVGEDSLEIRHVIPLGGPPRNSKGLPGPPNLRLRPDGVHPVPLVAGFGEHVPDGTPEAQCPVPDRELRRPHSALVEVAQKARPTLGGLPVAVGDGHQFLRPIHPDADHHQRTQPPVRSEPHAGVDAVHPHIHVVHLREVALHEALALGPPLFAEAGYALRRESRLASEELPQSRLEVPAGEAMQVE